MMLRLVCLFLVMLSVGCQRPKSDMAVQDKYSTFTPYPGSDQASQRVPPDGAVSREAVDDGKPPITAATVRNGQKHFDIFCSECHGRLGNGQGMIVLRGLVTPPSFHIDRLKNSPDQHFYDVITHGFGGMFSYNDRVSPTERWEIVYYIRALQQAADIANAPAEVRQALIAQGDRHANTGVPQ
jgi:mono/diheme cytochrome c family protein